MTYTRTWTWEERAWELALAATDPDAAPDVQQASAVEFMDVLPKIPHASRERIVAALRALTFAPEFQNVMPRPLRSQQ